MRTVVFTLLLSLFLSLCALGFWQLHRAHQKEAWLLTNTATPIEVTGHWLPQTQFLWDNQTNQGLVGYHIITPFQPTEGALILVDRGFIPAPSNRKILPSLPELPENTTTLVGQFFKPSVNRWVHHPLETETITWPLRVQKLDWPTFSAVLGAPLNPNMFHLNTNNTPQLWLTPSKHRGYAFQWFSLAATLLFLIYNYRRLHYAQKKL